MDSSICECVLGVGECGCAHCAHVRVSIIVFGCVLNFCDNSPINDSEMRENLLLEEEGKEVEKERGREGEEQGRREGGETGVWHVYTYTHTYITEAHH